MVVLPTGCFHMGDLDGSDHSWERPVHTVTISRRIAMGQYPITFEDYDQFVTAMGAERPGDEGWGRGRRPVTSVNWYDTKAYAAWLSEQTGKRYRLPSDSKWEYAARAGTETAYSWGNEVDINRANGRDSGSKWSGRQTSPVGSFAPNGLVCTICTAMCGSRWRTVGTTTMRAPLRMGAPGRAVVIAPRPSCAAAPGSLIRGFCVPPTASGSRRRIASTMTAFGLSRI